MGLLHRSREQIEREGPDPWLDVKILLFFMAAAIGLIGMILERDLLVYVGIGLLVVGLLMRLVPRRSDDGEG